MIKRLSDEECEEIYERIESGQLDTRISTEMHVALETVMSLRRFLYTHGPRSRSEQLPGGVYYSSVPGWREKLAAEGKWCRSFHDDAPVRVRAWTPNPDPDV